MAGVIAAVISRRVRRGGTSARAERSAAVTTAVSVTEDERPSAETVRDVIGPFLEEQVRLNAGRNPLWCLLSQIETPVFCAGDSGRRHVGSEREDCSALLLRRRRMRDGARAGAAAHQRREEHDASPRRLRRNGRAGRASVQARAC